MLYIFEYLNEWYFSNTIFEMWEWIYRMEGPNKMLISSGMLKCNGIFERNIGTEYLNIMLKWNGMGLNVGK